MSKTEAVRGELDAITHASLVRFAESVRNGWRGREFESVSFYAMGALLSQVRERSVLHDSRQICLLPCVPGVKGFHTKTGDLRVNADLAIFAKPGEYGFAEDWRPTVAPLAIQEWKVRTPRAARWGDCERPARFLKGFSQERSAFVGYLVLLDLRAKAPLLQVDRFEAGAVVSHWLTV